MESRAERSLRKFTAGVKSPLNRVAKGTSALRSISRAATLSATRSPTTSGSYTIRSNSRRRPLRRMRTAYRKAYTPTRTRMYQQRRYRPRGGFRANRYRSKRTFTISRIAGSVHPTLVKNSTYDIGDMLGPVLAPTNNNNTRRLMVSFLPFTYPDYTIPTGINQRIFGTISRSIINLSYDWKNQNPTGIQQMWLPPNIRWNLYIFRRAKEEIPEAMLDLNTLLGLHQGGFLDRSFDQTGLRKFMLVNQVRLLIFRRGMFFKRDSSILSAPPSEYMRTVETNPVSTEMIQYLNHIVPRREFELKLSLPVGATTYFLGPGFTNLGTRRWRYRCYFTMYVSERDWHDLPSNVSVPWIGLDGVIKSTQYLRITTLPTTTGTPSAYAINQPALNQI